MNYSAIKLVIWDLDDTFWSGTLSEGRIEPITRNQELVKLLTDCGVVNSICSKNNAEDVEKELSLFGVSDLFVFKSINWTPKGKRVSSLIHDMGLRPQNCLFIDDNPVNLNEAKHYEPELIIAGPEVIPDLIAYYSSIPASDLEHTRLRQYHVLEKKREARDSAADNMDFLMSSGTQVDIKYDCLSYIDRIHELVTRTNQLNYTKKRSSRDDLISICSNPDYKTGYVTVKDRFGDYGIVGFFALKDNVCVHFLFSCRTIGQGVEQFVYSTLGYPELQTQGEVVSQVDHSPAPMWINLSSSDCIKPAERNNKKVVFKGACDLKSMSFYLDTSNIIEEFTYITSKGINIEHHNHSVNYLTLPFLNEEDRINLLAEPFNDEGIFQTSMYDDDVAIVFLSTMIEPNLGIYRNKSNGLLIAWGEYLYPLTDKHNWPLYLDNKIFTAGNVFTLDYLEDFSNRYEFVGNLSPDQIVEQVGEVLKKVSPNTKLCYFLGSETPYEKNSQPNYDDRHLVYRQINEQMRRIAATNDRVLLIDFNDFIRGQEDFTNNINHFHRRVYYEAAMKANEFIAREKGEKLSSRSRLYLWKQRAADYIGKTGFFQSKFYSMLKRFLNK